LTLVWRNKLQPVCQLTFGWKKGRKSWAATELRLGISPGNTLRASRMNWRHATSWVFNEARGADQRFCVDANDMHCMAAKGCGSFPFFNERTHREEDSDWLIVILRDRICTMRPQHCERGKAQESDPTYGRSGHR
jgi:hypothetical protein